MTARKIVVAVLLCGLAAYFAVTWAVDKFRSRNDEPALEPAPEPERVEGARLVTTSDVDGAPDPAAAPWSVAFASPDVPLGAKVAVGEFGEDASALTIRQRGDVVASEMVVVAHRDELPPRTLVAYVGDTGDDFALENVTLFVWPKEDGDG